MSDATPTAFAVKPITPSSERTRERDKNPGLLRPDDAARYLAISVDSLRRITHPKGPIPYVEIGQLRVYDPLDLDEFIDGQKRGVKPEPKSEPAPASSQAE